MMIETEPTLPVSLARLEAVRLRLCKAGLHPGYHDTTEKAADAVCEMIEYFRRELANPPADVCVLVMRKYGVEGFMEEGEQPRCRLVSLPNDHWSAARWRAHR